MKPTTIALLQKCKQEKKRFATITAYDHSFAKLFADEGINVLLVGDSLGMTVQGHDSTLPVTVEDIAYHTRAVRRGAPNSLLLADLPFMAYATPEQTFENAAIVMRAGANMVKLEGGAWLADTVKMLAERAVPVCGHLGLTPQSVNVFGGYKVQGRGDAAQTLFDDALALEAAGAQLLVLECVPVELAKRITDALTIPVIGIGAGNVTKLANQVIVALNIAAMSEALTLATKAGVNPDLVYQAIRGGLAGSTVLDAKAPMVMDRNFKPGFRIDLHIKDLANALDTSHGVGAQLPLTAAVMEMMQALRADGLGTADHSALACYYEKLAKVEVTR